MLALTIRQSIEHALLFLVAGIAGLHGLLEAFGHVVELRIDDKFAVVHHAGHAGRNLLDRLIGAHVQRCAHVGTV